MTVSRSVCCVFAFLLVWTIVGAICVSADNVPIAPVERDLFEPKIPPGIVLELREVPEVVHEVRPDVAFRMRLAPASTYPLSVVNGEASIAVQDNFWIGETEVTYELWYHVRRWALRNGYTFANAGQEGSHGNAGRAPSDRRYEPVTQISWRDSIVWCNALSEWLGYDPVYTYRDQIVRDATQTYACDNAVQEYRDGFRLPTADEWVMAHRYRDGEVWAPENYASGATDDWANENATQTVAWYVSNSGYRTHDVGQKHPNLLYLYDMSGNVSEWVYDQRRGPANYGGGFLDDAPALTVAMGLDTGAEPGDVGMDRGLRLARTSMLRRPTPDIRIPDVQLP